MNQAVRVLQQMICDNGDLISVDGQIGPQTNGAIDKLNVPEYLKLAMKEIGTKEVPGSGDNPRVLEYHAVSGGYSEDAVPWCGSFVNWVMKMDGHGTVQIPARAKSWLEFGMTVGEPIVGCVAVKSRSGGGHVGFVVTVDKYKNELYLLGGNQNDEVNIKKYKISTFMDFRIPFTYGGYYASLAVKTDLSTSEA